VLAADLAGTGVLVNAASPGRMNIRMAWGETDRTAEAGAESLLWLTDLPTTDPPADCSTDARPCRGEPLTTTPIRGRKLRSSRLARPETT
jgi:NAD(P)-dependent dehydrogenase (short-subunit alcohol dehydrogenase family)